jgi:hypothetical protein
LLERLEDRLAPAINITVVTGAAGTGNLDHFLSASQGTIAVTDDPGDMAATLSTGALQGVGSAVAISITASKSISFNDLGTLSLQTGSGLTAGFTANLGAITFANTANTAATSGGSFSFTAGTDLTVANLNTMGGDVNLTAGTALAGNLSFQSIQTSSSGNLGLQATNAMGGTVTQSSGVASGLAINVTATGNISVNSLRGTTVSLTSNNGFVTSAGAQNVQASTELTVSAAAGINLNTLAASLQATNGTSGDVSIAQAATPPQTLTIVGGGVVNNASDGAINVTNQGSSITLNNGVNVQSNNGVVTLAGTDLQLNGMVSSGTARTILANSTVGRQIDIGTNTAGKIGLTQSELNNVTASVLQIGSDSAGIITVSAAVSNPAGWNVLRLFNGGSIVEAAAGSLTVPNLRVSSGGPVHLNNVNNVGTLAANTTNLFEFENGTNLLTIGTVDGDTGIVTTGSNIALTADDMDVAQQVSTGSMTGGTVSLGPFTNDETIDVGTNSPNHFGLTNAELNEVTAGVLLLSAGSGDVMVSAAISPANIGALELSTGFGAITQGSGDSITVQGGSGGLAIFASPQGSSSVTLNEANDVGKLAAAITGAGHNFSFTNSAGFAVSTVAGVVGISTATGDGETLVLNGSGAVSQDNGAIISSENLLLQGTGFALTDSGNSVSILAADVTNALSYVNSCALTVGTVTNPVTLSSTSGITTSDADISVTAGAVTRGSSLTVNQAIDTTSMANITLAGDQISLNAPVNAHGGTVTLEQSSTTGRDIDLGLGTTAGDLNLSLATLAQVSAGTLRVGRTDNPGNLTVTAGLSSPAGATTLHLRSGGTINQTSGSSITIANLAAEGSLGVSLTDSMNAVGKLAGTAAGTTGPALNFSTGNPDGKMATASRPPTAGTLEIEAADDFVLTQSTAITDASFVGLLPTGAPLGNVSQVVVEVYRVFPLDSNVARTSGPPTFSTSQVPTRVNSPSDNAFDNRDRASGGLTFGGAVLASSFMASNSVLNGINPVPNQTTGGEGPVTGEEVQFNVHFSTPFLLPAGHYFFVPQVGLTSGNFFWLSAPKPIVPPGTPFSPDLQEWIRNANLDPDWLRVGTDIVGGTTPPTFNGAFSLTGQVTAPFQFTDKTSLIVGSVGGDQCERGAWGRDLDRGHGHEHRDNYQPIPQRQYCRCDRPHGHTQSARPVKRRYRPDRFLHNLGPVFRGRGHDPERQHQQFAALDLSHRRRGHRLGERRDRLRHPENPQRRHDQYAHRLNSGHHSRYDHSFVARYHRLVRHRVQSASRANEQSPGQRQRRRLDQYHQRGRRRRSGPGPGGDNKRRR